MEMAHLPLRSKKRKLSLFSQPRAGTARYIHFYVYKNNYIYLYLFFYFYIRKILLLLHGNVQLFLFARPLCKDERRSL